MTPLVDRVGRHRLDEFGSEVGEIDHRCLDRSGRMRVELRQHQLLIDQAAHPTHVGLEAAGLRTPDRVEFEEQDGHRILGL